MLVSHPARADAPREVYQLRLGVDIPIVTVSALAITVPYLLAGDIIAKRCPCNPSEVNGFDRGAIGNHSGSSSRCCSSMVIRLRYGEQMWPWIATGAIGTSVAVERVAAGRHFPTDVIVGAVAGTAVGLVVPWVHARWASTALALAPAAAGTGLAVVGTLR